MSKNHRGTGVRTLPARGRGTCPICKKEHIKVLYEQTIDGQQVKICKYCNAALKMINSFSDLNFLSNPGEETSR